MARVITASLVVEFADPDGDGVLLAELDSFPTGLNAGNTNFVPGDQPGFLIYHSSNVVIDSITPSAGAISTLGGGTTPELIVDDLVYTDERTASFRYPNKASLALTQLGSNHDFGATTASETALSVQNVGVGVIRARYHSTYRKYRLGGVPATLGGETSYPVVIFITGHVVT